ncbi:MAG TPA: 50S ribosomal protein L16 [Spirochaetota bacterium]|nr:50S ribosomal protein L16 [Spirochaetota bacterium]HPP03275.1 50S ribosomal protein L16 [Spirochaetota bacterium]
MLMPKRTKFRKQQRWRFKGEAHKGNKVVFGDYGLMALEGKLITNRQIEATRRTITRSLKRAGNLWITIFPDIPYTKKPAETRQGNGKGNVEYYVAKVLPGKIMFEISGVSEEVAKEAFWLASQKLPIKTKMVKRETL